MKKRKRFGIGERREGSKGKSDGKRRRKRLITAQGKRRRLTEKKERKINVK